MTSTMEPRPSPRALWKQALLRKAWLVSAVVLAVLLPALWFGLTYKSRRSVVRIEALNGGVESSHMIPLPFVGRTLRLGELDKVYLLGPRIGDEELEALDGLPALRSLVLTNTGVTDRGLARLRPFRSLENLHITNTDYTKLIGPRSERYRTEPKVTGRGLESLKDLPNLRILQLVGSPTTDEDLMSLRGLKHLIHFELKDTKVTPAGVAELKKALPNCKITIR